MATRSLIVLPDDTVKPFLQGIEAAQEGIRIKMFIFTGPVLIDALLAAQKRGVKVKILLNPARRDGSELNEETRLTLLAGGIDIKASNEAFKVTHEKSMVIDEEIAYIQSLNWDRKNFTHTRDYAIATTHKKEVQEVISCFESDWYRTPFNPGETAHLIWCTGNGRARIAHFIDEAKHSLFIQNDRYQDVVVIERILRAVNRGVKVHVMAPPPHTLKKEKLVEGVGSLRLMKDIGIKIHDLKHLQIHAKMLLADNRKAIVGSINLAPGSFDDRRELAIEFDDHEAIHRLSKIAHNDWKDSYPLDLSDEGLYNDLENRGKGGSETLVLHLHKHHK